MATIAIVYTRVRPDSCLEHPDGGPLFTFPTPYYHKKLVFIGDSGKVHTIDGGVYTDPKTLISEGLLGEMRKDEYPNEKDFYDWTEKQGYSPPEILISGDDLTEQWAAIVNYIESFKDKGVLYYYLGANSNYLADAALLHAGLPLPTWDTYGKYPAPGSINRPDLIKGDGSPEDIELIKKYTLMEYLFFNKIDSSMDGLMRFFNDAKDMPPVRVDPLVLDLDGDGFEMVSQNAGITFDHNGNGVRQGTNWVKPDDGLLVFDRNGDGVINNSHEFWVNKYNL